MNKFTLIKSSPKEKRPSKQDLFREAFTRKLESLGPETTITDDMSLILLGVKAFSGRDDIKDPDYLNDKFMMMNYIQIYMGHLTPRQFLNTFPVRKTYDGKRYECKDYFSTMEMVSSLNMDKPIGDGIEDFLWDYMNSDTQIFTVTLMSLASDLMRASGKPGMLEQMSAEFGIPLYYGDKNGKNLTGPITVKRHGGEYCFDDSEAKILKRSLPKYLQPVPTIK